MAPGRSQVERRLSVWERANNARAPSPKAASRRAEGAELDGEGADTIIGIAVMLVVLIIVLFLESALRIEWRTGLAAVHSGKYPAFFAHLVGLSGAQHWLKRWLHLSSAGLSVARCSTRPLGLTA
jgi:hypothetical protein